MLHHLLDIPKSNKISKVWPWNEVQDPERENVTYSIALQTFEFVIYVLFQQLGNIHLLKT